MSRNDDRNGTRKWTSEDRAEEEDELVTARAPRRRPLRPSTAPWLRLSRGCDLSYNARAVQRTKRAPLGFYLSLGWDARTEDDWHSILYDHSIIPMNSQ